MFETKYFKEILHPLHFPEAKDPTTTPADEANAMRKRRKVVDVLIEKTIVQAEMEEVIQFFGSFRGLCCCYMMLLCVVTLSIDHGNAVIGCAVNASPLSLATEILAS